MLKSKGWMMVACALAMFAYGMMASMLGTLMSTFGLDPRQSSWIAAAQSGGLIVSSIAGGMFVDRRGKKPSLLIGYGVMAVALFALPHIKPAVATLVPLFLLIGLGGGFATNANNTLAGDIDPDKRASNTNMLNMFFGVGAFATPLVAANLLGDDNQKLCLVVAGLAASVVALHSISIFPEYARGPSVGMATIIKDRVTWLFVGITVLYLSCELGMWNWLALFLEKTRGIPREKALNTLSIGFALGLLSGRFGASRLLNETSPTRVVSVSAVFMTISTLVVLLVENTMLVWIAAFCAGLAMGPVFPTTLALVSDRFPNSRSTAMGIVVSIGWAGLTISSPTIGALSGGDEKKLGSALLLVPAFSATILAFSVLLRKRLNDPVNDGVQQANEAKI